MVQTKKKNENENETKNDKALVHLLPHDRTPQRVVLDELVHQGFRLLFRLQGAVGERSGGFHRHRLQRRRVDELVHQAHLQRLVRPDILPWSRGC